jgi:hypothetical protein
MNNEDADLVVVYVSQGPLAAEVARAKLEGEGIPVTLRYSSIGRVLGLTVDGLGRVEVVVPREHEAAARVVLEEDDALPATQEE